MTVELRTSSVLNGNSDHEETVTLRAPCSSSRCLHVLKKLVLPRNVLRRFSSSILRISVPEGLKISRRLSASAAMNSPLSPICHESCHVIWVLRGSHLFAFGRIELTSSLRSTSLVALWSYMGELYATPHGSAHTLNVDTIRS